MKRIPLFAILLSILACEPPEEHVYLFSYFTGRGKDGLHLAYSKDGYTWKALYDGDPFLTPELGHERLMRDPCIVRGRDGLFHMVWTIGWNEKGIGYAHSQDLVHWSPQRLIPVMEHEEAARNCWAPEITFVSDTDLYYIYWATTIAGRFPETDSTAESNYNHRIYYITTKDFEEFSETRLYYDAGFNVIDATLTDIGEGYVMFVKDETLVPQPQKNIRVVHAATINGPFSEVSNPITGPYWAEGPTALNVGGQWIVYFDKYREHQMGAVRSVDLVNWEDISDAISFPDGVRHGSAFRVPASAVDKILDR